jgi:hypothetical protein
MGSPNHLLGGPDVVRVRRPDEPVRTDGQHRLGRLEHGDLLVDVKSRVEPTSSTAAWAMLIECSSVPVRNRVSSPTMRCQRAMASAPTTSYRVCRPGLLFA